MTHTELTQVFTEKFQGYTALECQAVIKDCHETLRIGEYAYEHPYAQKLWAEIDVARARIHQINFLPL